MARSAKDSSESSKILPCDVMFKVLWRTDKTVSNIIVLDTALKSV